MKNKQASDSYEVQGGKANSKEQTEIYSILTWVVIT